jgi:integrase
VLKINKILAFEYDFEYDFKRMERKYSEVRIFDANGDLSKRWYIYFSYRNPATGKLERQPYIDAGINQHKTIRDRRTAAELIKKAVERALKNNYNPYGSDADKIILSIDDIFKKLDTYALNSFKESYYKNFKSRVGQFENWLTENNFTDISKITKRDVVKFLNVVEFKTSKRNRNNTRSALQSAFNFFEKEYFVERNFISDIEVLYTKPKRHKTYTSKQEAEIFKHLEENDKELYLFIKFISINFLRPIEVCRLQIKSFNLEEKKIYFSAKNKSFKIKIIPDMLIKELPDLSKYPEHYYLFTPDGIAPSTTTETNRRDYWTKRFKTVVKDYFNLKEDYTMYSFRHTFITKLYNELLKELTPFEAKSKLMLITGHNTMTALDKYLRDIDAVLPEDYSKYLENK